MEADRWERIRQLFEAASALDLDERAKFLKRACGGDEALRREVEALLASHESDESFMESPAVVEAASLFEEKRTLAARHTTGDLGNGGFVAGTILSSRYRILGLIGKGGMGEVYKADDIKLSQIVALKFLPDKLERDAAALNRFHAEVRLARQVSHPNVCRVFDIGETDGRHFLSMEYVDGDDLSWLLKRIGRLPSDKAVDVARQLCVGLAAIHNAGILHRDLKPANVIIDGKGKARITDFGIAGVEAELTPGDVRVGTPAYMSPEQIAGREVTQRSDIYSLGLLLYEIFTGKQTFVADSFEELQRQRRTTTPTSPSEILKEIDPLVERTILECLEKEPADRPPTALHVAMMLPGGNPLEAAMAAGQTPSPEMVAAAPKKGALRPAVAIACVSGIVALLAFIVGVSSLAKGDQWLPFDKSPEALAERAEAVLKKLGYSSEALDVEYGFGDSRTAYVGYANRERSEDRWERLRTGQPAIIFFWHRTSPRYLQPLVSEMVTADDPANGVAGMTKIILDTRGRLLRFEASPKQVRSDDQMVGEPDWPGVFTEAGLSPDKYTPTAPKWTPPSFADAFSAWEGPHVDHPDIRVRIEAASYRGRPVYFQIVAPWDFPSRDEEIVSGSPHRAAGIILTVVMALIVVAGVFLALKNVRNERSDNRGALKLSVVVFVVSAASGLLNADHIPEFVREMDLLGRIVGFAFLAAAVMSLLYLALEPQVRRRWPNLIISWNRLLAGDYRDPLVGRDILIGGLFGLAHTAIICAAPVANYLIGRTVEPNWSLDLQYLQGSRHVWADILFVPVRGMLLSFAPLLLLILFVALLKRQWLATLAVWTVYAVILGLAFAAGGGLIAWVWSTAIVSIIVFNIARFGLLSAISAGVFFTLSFHAVITSDPSRWFFPYTVLSVIIILSLAAFGSYTSLAGRSILRGQTLSGQN